MACIWPRRKAVRPSSASTRISRKPPTLLAASRCGRPSTGPTARPPHNRLTIPVSSSHPAKPGIRKKRFGQSWHTFLRSGCRWRGARWARRKLATVPPEARIAFVVATILTVVSLANVVYQVVRKPTELLFFVGGALDKVPSETWRQYGLLFRKYSTDTITPELLAALAQIESTGNPVARTYWRWRLTWNPFGVYKPASSAVGLYQMTDAAYAEASRYCVRRHAVVDVDCSFNSLYIRAVPNHAIELAGVPGPPCRGGSRLRTGHDGEPAGAAGSRRVHPSLGRRARPGLRAPWLPGDGRRALRRSPRHDLPRQGQCDEAAVFVERSATMTLTSD